MADTTHALPRNEHPTTSRSPPDAAPSRHRCTHILATPGRCALTMIAAAVVQPHRHWHGGFGCTQTPVGLETNSSGVASTTHVFCSANELLTAGPAHSTDSGGEKEKKNAAWRDRWRPRLTRGLHHVCHPRAGAKSAAVGFADVCTTTTISPQPKQNRLNAFVTQDGRPHDRANARVELQEGEGWNSERAAGHNDGLLPDTCDGLLDPQSDRT